MSAPSGIKVPPSLTSAFSTAQNGAGDVRALVFTIEGESFKHLTTVQPKSTYKDDISLLPDTLPSTKTPASFAYRLDTKDGGRYEWMMITFVPDDAGVRAKMLQASSRSGLLKSLGASNFKHDWFATSIKDLTPSALTAHLNHLASPPPLSASEAALAEVREAEAQEAKRAALDPETEARRRKVVVGLGGKMGWGEGVQEAMEQVSRRSDQGWVVVLEIPSSSPGSIGLITSESATPSQLSSKIPTKSPSYIFYSYPTPPSATPSIKAPAKLAEQRNTFQATQGGVRTVPTSNAPRVEEGSEEPKDNAESDQAEGETTQPAVEESHTEEHESEQGGKGRVIFIYCCPPASPVKFRMIYSTSVRGIQQDAMDKANVEIVGKIETSDPSDLTESHLKSTLPPSKPTHSSSLPTSSSTSNTGGGISSSFGGAQSSAQAAPFGAPIGGAFGRPRPNNLPVRSATANATAISIPLPASGPATPSSEPTTQGQGEEGDSKESIRRAFDAFGPRVNSPGGGGGGFARPRPAGRR